MTIGEFSVITGISAYTLRYYEKKGLLRVNRDSVGRRDSEVCAEVSVRFNDFSG